MASLPNNQPSPLDAAAAWMQQGHIAERDGDAQGCKEALRCYDGACASLLEQLESGGPRVRHAFAIASMNRGNVLQRFADPQAIEEAIRAYDVAIQNLDTLTPGDAALRNSLGAAWMNRGQALHRLGRDRLADAAASQRTAIAWLARIPREGNPAPTCNLAGAQVNLANVLLDLGGNHQLIEARDIARAALVTLAPLEGRALVADDLSLRARRSLCDALGQLLAADAISAATQEAIAEEIGDAIEDGLALSRRCEQQPQWGALREVTLRLFRIGARLYALHQPHFLGEFLLEHLDRPTRFDPVDFHAAADEALDIADARLARGGLYFLGDVESERALETRSSLEHTRRRLAVLRSTKIA
jgi:hypothetical protein